MNKFKELLSFGIIGGIGFLVDSGVLYLVKDELGVYVGRVVSFLAAVATTWILNKFFTFKKSHSGKSVWHEAVAYASCMVLGGAVNYLVYWLLVRQYNIVYENPILGVAMGSLAGMLFNYATAKLLIFNKKRGD